MRIGTYSMDFVVGFPKSVKESNAICVIVDRLKKSSHFLPVKMTLGMDRLVQQYIREVVRLHGDSVSIASYKDLRLPLNFRKYYRKHWDETR